MEDEQYKLEKENWVSGLSGSSLWDVVVPLTIIPLATMFHRTVTLILEPEQKNDSKNKKNLKQFVLDFTFFVIPLILAILFPQHYWILLISLITSIFISKPNLITLSLQYITSNSNDSSSWYPYLSTAKKPFLNNYRSSMMLITCLSILAVDFPIFPRKFAKTESYGVSLMDIGVGSFIISFAMVSNIARDSHSSNRFASLLIAVKNITPVFIFGIIRLILVKSTNYHEHVTEYGVHWNFFFTLAFVGLFSTLLSVKAHYAGTLGVILLLIYQAGLYMGLEDYILTSPRTNIISANKEGILSLFGYLSLYFISAQIGYFTLQSKTFSGWWKFVLRLILLVISLLGLRFLFQDVIKMQPSRRMVNIGYVLDTLIVNLVIIILCIVVDLFIPIENNQIVYAVSGKRNSQLLVFALANILTGLVNVSMKTLYASDLTSLSVLTLYMLIVTGFVYFIL
eukprot:TRINITY_DN2614_c0_g1_i1.p1 TRINITY_DN2614_c0_g1~~TRINITY_DN2614_c0_g1_i1.p1  ORF type:complete len:454 (+),score=30.63 TRINITY_DN2614_c0_g1_i1:43-1404(+)